VGLLVDTKTGPGQLRAVHDRQPVTVSRVGRATRFPIEWGARLRADSGGRQLSRVRHQGVGIQQRFQTVGCKKRRCHRRDGQQQRRGRCTGLQSGHSGQIQIALRVVKEKHGLSLHD